MRFWKGTNGVLTGRAGLDAGGLARIVFEGGANALVVSSLAMVSYLECVGLLTDSEPLCLTKRRHPLHSISGFGGGHGFLVNAAGGLIDLPDGHRCRIQRQQWSGHAGCGELWSGAQIPVERHTPSSAVLQCRHVGRAGGHHQLEWRRHVGGVISGRAGAQRGLSEQL